MKDKIEYGVDHFGNLPKDIHEQQIPLCSICKRNFLFLQDDYRNNPLDDIISRCMECYGDKFGLPHLLAKLTEMENEIFPFTPYHKKLLWEYPVDDPIIINLFKLIGMDITMFNKRTQEVGDQ